MPIEPSLFVQSAEQVVAIAAVAAVWLGFAVVGAAIGGRERMPEADVWLGWAAATLAFTLAGVFTPLPFTAIAGAFGALAVAAAVFVWRRDGRLVSPTTLRIVLLAAPLLVLVSAMRGSQWDDFSDWLLIPRYLLETDRFPGADNPFPAAGLIAYPYGWHLVGYLAGRVGGGLLESAGALMNVALLLGFGGLVIRLIERGLGWPSAEPASWGLCALGGLSTTLLAPTFVPKVALTSYADVPSAIATAVAAILAWLAVEALVDGRRDAARGHAMAAGLTLLVLVNLKQATLMLVLLVVAAYAAAAVRAPGVRVRDAARLAPWLVVPPLVVFLAWRYHVATELALGELAVRPASAWLVDLLPMILGKMLGVLSNKGYYAVLLFAAIGFGLWGLVRPTTPLARLGLIAAVVALGYNAFLAFSYIAIFTEFDGRRVASYWRYNMHLGWLVSAWAAFGLAVLWRARIGERVRADRLAWLPIALMLAAPFVFATKLRFDLEPRIVHFRGVGAEAGAMLAPGDRVFVADPTGSGESGNITAYELRGRASYDGYIGAYHVDHAAVLARVSGNPDVTAIVVHSVTDDVRAAFGDELRDGTSYLLKRDGSSAWAVVRRWPHPDGY